MKFVGGWGGGGGGGGASKVPYMNLKNIFLFIYRPKVGPVVWCCFSCHHIVDQNSWPYFFVIILIISKVYGQILV